MKSETMILAAINTGVWFTVFYVIIMLGKINRTQDEILQKMRALSITESCCMGVLNGK